MLICHLGNEDFCRELEAVCMKLTAAGLVSIGGGIAIALEEEDGKRFGERALREGVRLTEETLERLCNLLGKWPNAHWIFFPDDGYAGLVRLIRQFYTYTFSSFFPVAAQKIRLKSHRVTGNKLCGTPVRLRGKEMARAFRIWEEYKGGLSPVMIARRETTREGGQKKTLPAALMTVLRSLQRVHCLIYGSELPADRRKRRITGFDPERHGSTCIKCRHAKTEKQMCKEAQDYINQEVR